MYEALQQVKQGDTVLVTLTRSAKRQDTVTNVTPTLVETEQHGFFKRSDGRFYANGWGASRAVKIDPLRKR